MVIWIYRDDKPVNRTLITRRFTYHGSFLRTTQEIFVLHGDNSRLALENNSVYEGEFRYGFYHGCGKESNSLYEYTGEYKEGKRHGTGTIIAQVRNIYPELFKDGNMSYHILEARLMAQWKEMEMKPCYGIQKKKKYLLLSGVVSIRKGTMGLENYHFLIVQW